MLGISKILQDVEFLKTTKCVASFRPRGVLSGFLVIAPALHGTAVFVPPMGAKMPPRVFRMRLAPEVFRDGGAIFSAHIQGGEVVIEDILMYKGARLFQTMGFQERWTGPLAKFNDEWAPDDVMQGGVRIRYTEYVSVAEACGALVEGGREGQVVEFVPLAGANVRRHVWIPMEEVAAKHVMTARRESALGPDIYTLVGAAAGSGASGGGAIALVRTLAISRALKLVGRDEFRVEVAWNKMFERQEIVGIQKSAA